MTFRVSEWWADGVGVIVCYVCGRVNRFEDKPRGVEKDCNDGIVDALRTKYGGSSPFDFAQGQNDNFYFSLR
jgi:hypothetical protein